MLWAIDIGNSDTVVGVWDTKWGGVLRWPTHYDGSLKTIEWSPNIKSPSRVIIGSVVPEATLKWQSELDLAPIVVHSQMPLPIEVKYENSESLGADRIANAVAAKQRFGGNCITIDFGTATTFDVINTQGCFIGGAILPGLMTAAKTLSSNTAKLPITDLIEPEGAIGRSTIQCLRVGLVLGYADMIEGLIGRMSNELQSKPHVIATGGLAFKMKGLCASIDSFDVMHTLNGLKSIAEMIS